MADREIDTPKRAKVRGAFEYFEAKNLPYEKTKLFDYFEVPHEIGYQILADENTRTGHNNTAFTETRGCKRALSESNSGSAEKKKSSPTTDRKSASRDLYKQLAADVETDARRRVECAKAALTARPRPHDWHSLIFSHECHFEYNIEDRAQPEGGAQRQIPALVAFGYDFRWPMIWLEKSNKNGKIVEDPHKKTVIDSSVKCWIDKGYSLVSEDDGLESTISSRLHSLKRKHGGEHFFNCPQGMGLSVIEDCWMVPKQYIQEDTDWDFETFKKLAEEGWDELSQGSINHWIDAIPQRLQHVIDMEGKVKFW